MLVPFLCSLTGIGCNFGLIWVSSLSKSTILAIALNYLGSLRQILAMRWNCQRRYVPARSHSQAQSHSVWFCVIVRNGLFILGLVTKRTSDPSNPTCLPRSPYKVHGILWNRRRGTFTLDLFLEHSHYSNSILNYTDDRSNHIQLPVFSLADSLNLVELPTRQGRSRSHSHDTLKSLKISRIARGHTFILNFINRCTNDLSNGPGSPYWIQVTGWNCRKGMFILSPIPGHALKYFYHMYTHSSSLSGALARMGRSAELLMVVCRDGHLGCDPPPLLGESNLALRYADNPSDLIQLPMLSSTDLCNLVEFLAYVFSSLIPFLIALTFCLVLRNYSWWCIYFGSH